MYISKRKIKASTKMTKRPIKADEALVDEEVIDVPAEEEAEVVIEPEATDLLFEVEDVAELVAEVTGEEVEVSVDEETGAATFAVGGDEITVEPEGDEEILESVRKPLANKKAVSASRKIARRVPSRKSK